MCNTEYVKKLAELIEASPKQNFEDSLALALEFLENNSKVNLFDQIKDWDSFLEKLISQDILTVSSK